MEKSKMPWSGARGVHRRGNAAVLRSRSGQWPALQDVLWSGMRWRPVPQPGCIRTLEQCGWHV